MDYGNKKNYSFDRIELRSEEVRNIIGTVPTVLVRWGIAIIIFILVILMLVVFLVPYPYGEGETIFQYILFTK